MAEYKILDYEKTRELCLQIFEKYGFSKPECETIVEILLAADLAGIESHGIQRLVRYHNGMKMGEVDIKAKPEIVHETPVSAVVHAHKAMGQVVSKWAMELAIEKAKKTGIGIVTVSHSNHYGIAGYYTRMAADADMMGICMTNTEAIMVPTFGKQAMLGTNPIAVAMPATPTPFVFDAATTVVPRGKLEVYNKKGQAVPLGWVIDNNGADTSDAGYVLENIIAKSGGGILPLGGSGELNSGYKGYGFGLICELFTAIAAGGATSNHAVEDGKNEISHCFWAIDYGIFGNKQQMKENFSAFLQELRDSYKAEGQSRVYIHGEKELESEVEKWAEGLPVNQKTFGEIQAIAAEMGVDSTPYIGTQF
ncbi:Ldh family oxidoreductase [Ruminococcaceae bacterium OttesenSCG-928-A16]|nr:Ldh family oxidoreductase [Ruminococcaceae bacterium OttesenSCG-928-A16]